MASGSSCHTWEGAGMPGRLVGVLFLYPGSLLLVHFVHVRRAHTVESLKLNLGSIPTSSRRPLCLRREDFLCKPVILQGGGVIACFCSLLVM